MAYQNLGLTHSFPAAADHSANQFKFMKINSSAQAALCDTLGERVDGVLQDKPASGYGGSVMIGVGVTKITLGATLSAGDLVAASAAGVAVAAQTGHSPSGKLLEGGVSGNIVSMIFYPGGMVNVDAATARTLTLPAAADYSTTGQYLFMEINSSGKWSRVTGDGAKAQGVLQNAPAADADAIVAVDGVCTVKIGADSTAAGAQVESETTTSRAIAVTIDAESLGTLIAGGDDGDDVQMLLQLGAVGHSHT